ncbi:MAG TPA: hypothetical protein ENH84_03605 [Phycisphaerae bacterium]|nr:hypothetical protein [Phycisphaerae bacterium]
MKDAKTYERGIRKLLMGAKKNPPPMTTPPGDNGIQVLIESILLADATKRDVEKAVDAIGKEFVDFNEFRVAPQKEIIECLGKDYPEVRDKAHTLVTVLNGVFNRSGGMTITYMQDMSKRETRRHLRELGAPPFAEALVSQSFFGVHAIPVDQSLFDVLQMNNLLHAASDIEDTQSFLERIIVQKNGPAAHAFFRDYVARNATALEKKRKADAKQKAAEEEAARKAAEKAERRAAKEEARKAEIKAAKLAKKKAKPPKKSGRKKKASKVTRTKVARKPAKKAAETVKKAVKKTVARKKTATKKAAKKAKK